jgi:hypothetical protein
MFGGRWDHIPWEPFRAPSEVWLDQPTFVVGEWMFVAGALVAAAHAWRNGRLHMLVWLSALIAGSANDAFFMWIPIVDNFWQAQASVMMSPRMPLYISCVYINFMYFGTVAAWKLHLPPRAEAALAGLCAELIYAPYDIVGIKFLWWTWHDTDSSIAERLLGVPIGSTMWVITFSATFSYLLRATTAHARFEGEPLTARDCLRTFSIVSLCSTPIMMVQMTVLQFASGTDIILERGLPPSPVPGPRGFALLLASYGYLLYREWGSRRLPKQRRAVEAGEKAGCTPSGQQLTTSDLVANLHLLLHFGTLLALMVLGEPEAHVAMSMHQRYGPCGMRHLDITGNNVTEFVCAADYDEGYSFDCSAALADGRPRSAAFGAYSEAFGTHGVEAVEAARTFTIAPESSSSSSPHEMMQEVVQVAEWYSVCGLAHTNYRAWVAAEALLALVGVASYSAMLGGLQYVWG